MVPDPGRQATMFLLSADIDVLAGPRFWCQAPSRKWSDFGTKPRKRGLPAVEIEWACR
jgi:hypothetical protein